MSYKCTGIWLQGKCQAISNSKYGIVNIKGDIIVPFIYEYMSNTYDKYLKVLKNNKWGFIDRTNGNIITSIKYDYIGEFGIGTFILAKLNGKYGYINRDERIKIPFKYDNIDNFDDYNSDPHIHKRRVVYTINTKYGPKYGIITKKGKEITPAIYSNKQDVQNKIDKDDKEFYDKKEEKRLKGLLGIEFPISNKERQFLIDRKAL